MLSFKEAFQYFATSFWTKSKNTFLTIENGINGILLDPKYELVNSVTNNTSITLPSLDTFDEIYIEMTNGENTVVHQASVKKGSLLSDNSAVTYREILLDGIHDTQTYVTYDIATNTITPSYCEGVVINGTTNVTTTVYVKKYVVSETTTTLSSGIISYDDTKANLGTDNLQGAIEKLDDKIDGIEQTAINTSYNNTTSGLSATNVQGAIDENASIGNQALAIAKGRNQSLAYNNYSEMITALNSMGADELKRGQNIYIGTVGVPDLWVYGVETSSVTYSYVDDETIVGSLGTDTTIQVGYYKLAQLETQKVDLTNIESDINDLQTSDTDINALITALTNRVTELENSGESNEVLHYLGELTSDSTHLFHFLCDNTVNLKIIFTGYDSDGSHIRDYFNSVNIKINTSNLIDGRSNNFIYTINSPVSSDFKLTINYNIYYSKGGYALNIELVSITVKSGTSSWNVHVTPYIYVVL